METETFSQEPSAMQNVLLAFFLKTFKCGEVVITEGEEGGETQVLGSFTSVLAPGLQP